MLKDAAKPVSGYFQACRKYMLENPDQVAAFAEDDARRYVEEQAAAYNATHQDDGDFSFDVEALEQEERRQGRAANPSTKITSTPPVWAVDRDIWQRAYEEVRPRWAHYAKSGNPYAVVTTIYERMGGRVEQGHHESRRPNPGPCAPRYVPDVKEAAKELKPGLRKPPECRCSSTRRRTTAGGTLPSTTWRRTRSIFRRRSPA
jgi:hypothetical protein